MFNVVRNMTPDQALAIVASKAAGRTRYEGQEPYLDEVLAAEVRRLRGIVAALCDDVEAYVSAEYPQRDRYRFQMRKFENEMETIREYRRSIGDGNEIKR